MGCQIDLNALYDIYLGYRPGRQLALSVVNQAVGYPFLGDIYGPKFVNGERAFPMDECTENGQGQPPCEAFLKLTTISGGKLKDFREELLDYSDASGELLYADEFILAAWNWLAYHGLENAALSHEQWKVGWVRIMACMPMESEVLDDECLYNRFCKLVRGLDGLIFVENYGQVWKDGEETDLATA
ncbi:hypothetical protein MHUMG1_07570 [Metarhizium humberi]|uniref:Uncharacterized protein n=1 Tax=Metarhizium humberi TaxID=2596975 RepID=A0A9P8S4M8_9HYPO|nr:hypothetical protein MHUMG1_07570 [Metarhizium humberi]